MDESSKTLSTPWNVWAPKKWMALIVGGLVLGEAVWVAVVALTRDVVLPLMAMALGDDTASPLSLGKQDFNIPDLFTAVLELCLAGLFVIALYAWIQRKPKAARIKSLSLTQTGQQIPQTTMAVFQTAAATPTANASRPAATRVSSSSAPVSPSPVFPSNDRAVAAGPLAESDKPEVAPLAAAVAPPPAAAPTTPPPPLAATKQQTPAAPPVKSKPAKAREPKPVYYNLVGERITPPDDDETGQ